MNDAQILQRELESVREHHRRFKEAVLAALGFTDPWAITSMRQADIEQQIRRLRRSKQNAEEPSP